MSNKISYNLDHLKKVNGDGDGVSNVYSLNDKTVIKKSDHRYKKKS